MRRRRMAEERQREPLAPLDLAALLTLLGQAALRKERKGK